MDQDGVVQWQKHTPDPTNSNPVCTGVTKALDGGHVVTGNSIDSFFIKKFDPNGQLMWEQSYFNTSYNGNEDLRITTTLDGGFIVSTTILEPSSYISRALIIKIDSNGVFEWDMTFGNDLVGNKPLPVIVHDNNTYSVVSTVFQSKISSITRIDSIGNILWQKDIVDPDGDEWYVNDAARTNDGGVMLLADEFYSQRYLLVKTDSIGNLVWDIPLSPLQPNQTINNLILNPTMDGGALAYITVSLQSFPYDPVAVFVKVDQAGTIEWSKMFPFLFADYVDVSSDGACFIASRLEDETFRAIKLDKNGNLYGNFVMGNVHHDLNLNCTKDPNEQELQKMLVAATGSQSFYGFTDTLGNYAIEVDTGNYYLNVIKSPIWGSCNAPGSVQVNPLDSIITNLPLKSLVDCPDLSIAVDAPFLRRCFDNQYMVSYCNLGTMASPITTIDLNFHPHLDVISSSIPWISQTGNTYTFQVGNLGINECGSFKVIVNPNCDSTIIVQTLCVNSNIYPDSSCIIPSTFWDGSITDLEVHCGTDSLTFTIKNIGLGDMGAPLVIEDNLITKQGLFQLLSQESMQLKFPANGSTYRLYAGQAPGYFPPNYTPTIAYEGCGLNTTGEFSTGFITMYPENNALSTETVSCTQLSGSFDPNDKQATPKGYGPEHYIEVGDDLEYKIRFQNTGNDTAFTVVVRDTITEHLDIGSLIQGPSSHRYSLDIIHGNVLKFTFNNILLVDSTTNEPESHGFIKFKISQQPNLPLGTSIYNSAAIYFDFNVPVITNETYHEIAEDFIPIVVTSVSSPEFPEVTIRTVPNPFVHYTEFILENAPIGVKTFELHDALGRSVSQETFTEDSNYLFYRKNLAPGIYFYSILHENKPLVSGKLIVSD